MVLKRPGGQVTTYSQNPAWSSTKKQHTFWDSQISQGAWDLEEGIVPEAAGKELVPRSEGIPTLPSPWVVLPSQAARLFSPWQGALSQVKWIAMVSWVQALQNPLHLLRRALKMIWLSIVKKSCQSLLCERQVLPTNIMHPIWGHVCFHLAFLQNHSLEWASDSETLIMGTQLWLAAFKWCPLMFPIFLEGIFQAKANLGAFNANLTLEGKQTSTLRKADELHVRSGRHVVGTCEPGPSRLKTSD